MPAAAIIALIVQYGPGAIALVQSLITSAENNQVVTAAQFNKLIQDASQSAKQLATVQLIAAGIDPTSTQGIAFLALVK
jgi:hypothetical protein